MTLWRRFVVVSASILLAEMAQIQLNAYFHLTQAAALPIAAFAGAVFGGSAFCLVSHMEAVETTMRGIRRYWP